MLPGSSSKSAPSRNRKREVLFIDARQLGFMKDRVLRDFTPADLEKISGTFRAWKRPPVTPSPSLARPPTRTCPPSANPPPSPKSPPTATSSPPGRYVGAEDVADDGEPFGEKMPRLVAELHDPFAESATLESQIRRNLAPLGYHS